MASPIIFNSPLGPDVLRFQHLRAMQGVSQLGSITVNLVSDKPDLSADKLLGQAAGVSVLMRDGKPRHFNGVVTRFAIGPAQGRHYGYQAVLHPWLWLLTRTSDCRIFQNQNVQQIVEAVFADHAAVAQFRFKLTRSYATRTYCVQYRETDYNFIARLLEEEGIYWFFEHTDGQHTLVLTDAVSMLDPSPGCPPLRYFPNTGQVPPNVDTISQWAARSELQTGQAAAASFDFERPAVSLLTQQSLKRGHAHSDLEQYDYDGRYIQLGDGQQLRDNRMDEVQSDFQQAQGDTNAIGLTSGYLFELQHHPHASQNGKFICLSTEAVIGVAGYEAEGGGAGGAAVDYHCRFVAAPSAHSYRPPRRTGRPSIYGTQTAVVVGPAGEEIYTDKYGRVKVQFHWDRYGKRDDKSSCWVRVASPWAGNSFGFVQVPRIGQEVVVNFLEGDPDQPLITGRVYNAANMPPWELPANATQSGVLSRSSKGGVYSNANALRFEDKKGSEQLWLHAEKNQDIEVENDETHWVGHDRTKTIDHDETTLVKHNRTETVNGNETITIHQNRMETVDLDETITIHKNRTETVDLNENITIGVNRTEAVGANETITIGANETVTIGANESVTIGANRTVTVGGAKAETIALAKAETIGLAKALTIGAAYQTSVGGLMNTSVGLTQSAQIGQSKSTDVGKKYNITAGDEFTITVGKASLVMKKDGSITLKGKDILIDGSGNIKVKASSDVVIKGSKIAEN
ncbi:MAG: type VI secretion system tip protein VgrG [Rubrivivax sp.]|nr:MAG: type VI secretion system tip protein VgrG [Rubrivivax sp.]